MTWTGRRVLVTGADGFIGSHLTEALARAGANVRAFCLYNSSGWLGWLENSDVRDALDIRLGDIRDGRFVDRACKDVEVVFHLAALIAIPYSYMAPESFIDTNVRGTLHVLEAVRRNGCRRLVHTSTSEVYGTPDSLPIAETHPLRGQSPYSASKIAADKLSEAYYCSFDVPVVMLRPFNTFGPRQSARAVVPTILSQLLSGRVVVRLGSVEPRRDLTYVSDVVDGFLAAGSVPGIEGRVIQLGTGRAVSILDLFEAACAACGIDAVVEPAFERFRPPRSEVMVLQSDPSLAAALLGWRPTVSLEDGLRHTAAWMRQHTARFRPDVYAV
jgi:NAD dependent epimerase/dehydratase